MTLAHNIVRWNVWGTHPGGNVLLSPFFHTINSCRLRPLATSYSRKLVIK